MVCSWAQFGHSVFLFLVGKLAFGDMWLETFVEVEHACYRIDDGDSNQKQCDDS